MEHMIAQHSTPAQQLTEAWKQVEHWDTVAACHPLDFQREIAANKVRYYLRRIDALLDSLQCEAA